MRLTYDTSCVNCILHLRTSQTQRVQLPEAREKTLSWRGVPESRVDIVGMLVEGGNRGQAVVGSKLDRVVPGVERTKTRQRG